MLHQHEREDIKYIWEKLYCKNFYKKLVLTTTDQMNTIEANKDLNKNRSNENSEKDFE